VEKIEILVITSQGKIPLNIYSHQFTWRELVLPPILAITVKQGHQTAEIKDYQQFNFLLEVIQKLPGFGGQVGDETKIPISIMVMGNVDKRVDVYRFQIYHGKIVAMSTSEEVWGAELEGASTSGWKIGIF
jgi:hypothetical protein